MKKRIVLWALPLVLLAAIFGVLCLQYWPRSAAERWLWSESWNVQRLEITYGSPHYGTVDKYMCVTNKMAIHKILLNIRCRGSMEEVGSNGLGDEVMGYNTCYSIIMRFDNADRQPETLVFYPSGGPGGIFFVTRQQTDRPSTDGSDIIGWAEMNYAQLQKLERTLQSLSNSWPATKY